MHKRTSMTNQPVENIERRPRTFESRMNLSKIPSKILSKIRVRNNINTRKEGHKIIISIPQNYNILAILKMETFLKFPISDSSMMKLAKIQRFESKVQPWVFHPHPPIWGMKITVIGGDTRWFQPNTNDTRNRIPGWWNKQLLPSGEMLASRKCLHWLERKSCP